MRNTLSAALVLAAGMANGKAFEATLAPPWDGMTVPQGLQCRLFGGNGATPTIAREGLLWPREGWLRCYTRNG